MLVKTGNLRPVVEVDEGKCVACHQCISVCPVKFCNEASGDTIHVNADLCIGCGRCIAACSHGARVAVDDFEEFMEALTGRERIAAIVAPAVAIATE